MRSLVRGDGTTGTSRCLCRRVGRGHPRGRLELRHAHEQRRATLRFNVLRLDQREEQREQPPTQREEQGEAAMGRPSDVIA